MNQNQMTKIQLGNMDFLKYNEGMQAEWKKDNGKRFCYPITLSESGAKMVPSLLKLYSTIDELKALDRASLGDLWNDQDSDKMISKQVKLEFGMGEGKRIYLEYTRARFYFLDPISGMVQKIWLPLLPAEADASGYLKFVSQFTEAFMDIYTFANIMMATNKTIIDSNIRGLGFEFFEKLVGTTNVDPLTEAAIKAGLEAGADRDKINEAIKQHESEKSAAIIFDYWIRKRLNKYASETKQIAKDLEDRAKAGVRENVVMETADATPVFPKRPEPKLTPVTDSNRVNYGAYSLL